MNTTTISIKTDRQIKAEAKKIAEKLGFSLSGLLNGFLKQFVKTKTVPFASVEEELTPYAKAALKRAEKNYKQGKGSPMFTDNEELIKKDPKKYQHIDTMSKWLQNQGYDPGFLDKLKSVNVRIRKSFSERIKLFNKNPNIFNSMIML